MPNIRGGDPRRPQPYNPLEKRRLAESIVRELLESTPEALPPAEPFVGAGVYAIYYKGDFETYRPLADLNATVPTHPIYVGKAISPGGRKGGLIENVVSQALFKRLSEHGSSIEQVGSLQLADFTCRFLVVDEFWIPLAESLLIERYRPLWNLVVDGFGNHDPGGGRRLGRMPLWDMLHPGRTWAALQQPAELTLPQIIQRLRISWFHALPKFELIITGSLSCTRLRSGLFFDSILPVASLSTLRKVTTPPVLTPSSGSRPPFQPESISCEVSLAPRAGR